MVSYRICTSFPVTGLKMFPYLKKMQETNITQEKISHDFKNIVKSCLCFKHYYVDYR